MNNLEIRPYDTIISFAKIRIIIYRTNFLAQNHRLPPNHFRWHNPVNNNHVIFNVEDIIPFLIMRYHSASLRMNLFYGF